MAQLFTMPQLGSTMEEGVVLKWYKQEGEAIHKGEVLLEIETDKASMEVDVTFDGVVRKLLLPEGATVPIKQPIAIIGTADEPIDALLKEAGLGGNMAEPAPASNGAAIASTPTVSAPEAAPALAIGQSDFAISPRARRAADENRVPVVALAGRGTGPNGRVIERDVLAYLEEQKSQPAIAASNGEEKTAPRVTPLAARIADDLGVNLDDLALGLPGSRVRREDVLRHAETQRPVDEPAPVTTTAAEYTVQPFAGMRKRIADNIVKSAFTAPHVTLTLEVDMTEAAEFRQRLIPDVEKAYGARLSYTDILVKAVARALGEFPRVNAALVGDEIRIYAQKNIGVAVALDEGLVVPVVKEADKKSLGAVSSELKQLVERARTGKFTPDDLAGGTFSITNLGAFGIDVFDPVIVPPQAAILGVGRIADKAVVINKEVVVRTTMNLCLSFDHRVLDGAPAARFLQRLKELLETPMLILI